ncbi:MAG: M20 family metallopeptidase [Ornithinimicrobium sp.]|uniref:M20 metallopeptidase family protein n=1 Tax=Ornithinimicrobium sp. TaxID=1977084 RepID=UPI0026DF8F9D|nr:M20 family metallopeptidase [Ornithinimicrobium sp.]MDO5739007.1 M20 family metallopeptidase [Ornithinimicrobium sp.]
MTLLTDAASHLFDLVELRRALHQIPEVGLDLPQTQQLVLNALEGLPLEITTGTATTSIVAVLRGGRPGPTVLLRGDMDALPVREATDLPYASANGAMHACGHDLHVAGLVGAARLLSARREELAGNVLFMFQPGEEGYGGAKVMLEEGLLEASGDLPIAAYGIHVSPGEHGVFWQRSGPALAGSNTLHITVTGKGGHGSQPHTAIDPVAALVAIAADLQTMVTRRFSVFDPVVLTITQLSGGEAINVIPDTAALGATVRTLSAQSVETMRQETARLAEGIAAAHGCTAAVDFQVQYPVTINDPDESAWVLEELRGVFGTERVEDRPDPLMGSEDFSYVLQEVPGTFFFLQCTPPELDPTTVSWNHSAEVLFDDAVLADQAAALAHLAIARLEHAEMSQADA